MVPTPLKQAPVVSYSGEKYQVKLPQWTGPYDLLLQVIEEQKLNLFDLDIACLLDHYLRYLETLEFVDIDEGGEFLLVAATLAQIKSKLLLPKEEQTTEEEEKDPRAELAHYLQEYQKFKQAAELLREQPLLGRDVFLKGGRELFEGLEVEGHGSLFQLARGFQRMLQELKAEEPFQISKEEWSVSDRMRTLIMQLQEKKEIVFEDCLQFSNRVLVIVTFLAILELARLEKIKIFQRLGTAPIILQWVEGVDMNIQKSEFDQPMAEVIS